MAATWIPGDDLLLKNAVELGASLEAVAKGVVQFSRKYTIQEIRERWHSLLYDPVISNEASTRMANAEMLKSRTNKNTNSNVPVKRKLESVRMLFYSLRKKTCHQPQISTNETFICSPTVNGSIGYVNGNGDNQEQPRLLTKPSVENHIHGDFIQDQLGFQELDGEKSSLCSLYGVHSGLIPVGVSESDVDLSDTLLNFTNEDEIHLMDVDDKSATQKSPECSPNPVSLSDNIRQNDVASVEKPRNSVSNEIISESNDETKTIVNTADLEAPCIDHIYPHKSSGYSCKRRFAKLGIPGFYVAKRRKKLGQKEKRHLPVSVPISRMNGNVNNGHRVKKEFPDDKFYYSEASARAKTGNGVSTQSKSATLAPNSAANIKAITKPLHAKEKSVLSSITEPGTNALPFDLEESLISEESENGDMPCFSDVEAMILEMDLCPEEPGSSISKEVNLKYRDESIRRSIIRLEQGAQSSMQRCLASKGAFAVFYGRHLKHYIKKTEVVIGRATDELDVDIDVRREGPAQRISRRQAVIKLGSDGSFTLTNLGKNSVYLNGMEVQTGHVAILNPSSLIEIKDFSFIFEISRKCVARYLSQIAEGNCETRSKFDCMRLMSIGLLKLAFAISTFTKVRIGVLSL
ncbi:hypothetical protein ACFE04_021907 [Oxalis oulophora]